MPLMRRLLIFVAIVAVLIGHRAVIADDAGPVTIRAEDLPSPIGMTVDAIAAREVLKAFLAEHPDIQCEPFVMPGIGGTAMDSGPLMAISAGIPPHVMRVNFRQSSTYLEQGFLEPLEILLARVLSSDPKVRETDRNGRWLADPPAAEVDAAREQLLTRVARPALPVVYRRSEYGDGQKHVWAVPTTNQVAALMYRRDLFAEAGLDPDKPPRTWEEFLEAARALMDPAKQQHGYLFRAAGDTFSWAMYSFLASNGVEPMKEDAEGNWTATYNTEAAAETVLFVWRLLKEPFTKPGYDQPIQGCAYAGSDANLRWTRGQGGMMIGPIREELIATIDPQLVGIAPVPTSPRGGSSGEVNAAMFGVFSQASPRQKLAAMTYIWFTTSDHAKRIRTEVYVKNGYGKFVSPDLLERFGYDRLLMQVPKGWQETFRNAIEAGLPEPYGKNTQNIYREMSAPINLALEREDLGSIPREEAIAYIKRLLDESVEKVNRVTLGKLPPEVLRQRRMVAIPVLILVFGVFAFGMWRIWKYFSLELDPTAGTGNKWRKFAWGYLLLIPGVGLVVLWAYLPLLMGLSISFVDFRIVRDSVFVGIDNFAHTLYDVEGFWLPLWRTLYFVALTIGLGFWPPILLAVLLQEVPTDTAKYVYRTIYYIPAVLSGLVVMFLWKQLYDPSPYGLLNQIVMSLNSLGPVSATAIKLLAALLWLSCIATLMWLPFKAEDMARSLKLGLWALGVIMIAVTAHYLIGGGLQAVRTLAGPFEIQPVRWLQDPALAMVCVVIPSVWAHAGPGCIIYLAALKSVPDELYEAADIDGAGLWHKVFYIVLPSLKYLIVIQFVGAVTGAFKGGVEMIMVMTEGGPLGATRILALEIFYRVFQDLQFGIGTAMAWMLGAILIGFTAYQLKMLRRAEFKAGGSTT